MNDWTLPPVPRSAGDHPSLQPLSNLTIHRPRNKLACRNYFLQAESFQYKLTSKQRQLWMSQAQQHTHT